MKCPGCGLYHPPQYESCVSCGTKLSAQANENEDAAGPVVITARPAASDVEAQPSESRRRSKHVQSAGSDDELEPSPESLRRSKHVRSGFKSGTPTSLGILVAVTVLLVSAGATFFFITKPPDDQRLYDQGQKELQNGQYAFAVKTLNQALSLRTKDPKVYLSLARAYVGVDQVEKAWDCIKQAQQLGAGVASEPALASDLANYYRQRSKYDRAVELLRPLAQAGIPGKKAELADLDALWGDEALRSGKVEHALKCWEEVRGLREGSRYSEAEARLATIYQKLANAAANNKDDTKALAYLSKLNNIAQNARNYEMASDIYDRTGELELAIDQLRKAIHLSTKNSLLDKKLGSLLSRRGKELLDAGNTDAGYGYLQQAKDLNGDSKVPEVTLRNLFAGFDASHMPKISGEVWNPTERAINSLNLKVELYDNISDKSLWTKEQKMVDEFVPPLGAKDTRAFEFVSTAPAKANGTVEFRVYIDGNLYKSYPIGKKGKVLATAKGDKMDSALVDEKTTITPTSPLRPIMPKALKAVQSTLANPPKIQTIAPTPTVVTPPDTMPPKGPSAEEKTMKDLEP